MEKWVWNKQVITDHCFGLKCLFLTADDEETWTQTNLRLLCSSSAENRASTLTLRLWVRLLWEVLPSSTTVEILIQLSSFPATSVESKPSPEVKHRNIFNTVYESQWLRSDSRLPCFIGCFWRWKVEMPTWRHNRQQEDTQLWHFSRVPEQDHVMVTPVCPVTPLKPHISLHL